MPPKVGCSFRHLLPTCLADLPGLEAHSNHTDLVPVTLPGEGGVYTGGEA